VARFDRYMLSECVLLFGFFSLLLVLVFWINRAVSLFDRIIADGQSARVFLELSALQLPYIILLVLPISAFAAVLQVTNRMSSDSELTIMQATGYSGFRLARPVLFFSVIVAVMVAVLTHLLVPISSARLADRQQEISDDSTARLLREGEFLHPNNRSTLYVRDLTPEGELRDVFLSQRAQDGTDQIYTSKTAFLLRGEDGPQIVMIDGLAQSRDPDTNRLFTTSFDDFVVDVATLTGDPDDRKPALRELDTRDLLDPDQAYADRVQHNMGALKQELHERLSRSLFPIVTSLLGFAVLLSGRFSRFGVWRQIGVAVALLIVLKVVEGAAAQRIQDDPSSWFLAYLPFVLGVVLAVALLWNVGRRRRVRQVGTVPA